MLKRTALAILLVLAGFVAGLVLTGRMRSASEGAAAQPARTADAPGAAAASQPPAVPGPGLPDFSVVAGRAVGGIVSLSAVSVVRTSNSPFANDPVFRQFFGESRRVVRVAARAIVQPRIGRHHLRRTATSSPTTTWSPATSGRSPPCLPDKREVKGELVGRDPMTDIAVVKIDARNLPVLPVGRLVEDQGGPVGARRRQPVRAEPDGHARHRERGRPNRAWG